MISILSLCCLTSTAMPQEPSAPASQVGAQTAFTVPLKFRGTRKWKVQLPAERWSTVGTGFDFTKTHGQVFKTALEGTRLQIDSDGDGATDVTVEGKTAFVTMRSGSSAYAVRLQNKQGWKFAPGGYLTGTIKGQKIRIIDQDNNGSFADPSEPTTPPTTCRSRAPCPGIDPRSSTSSIGLWRATSGYARSTIEACNSSARDA